MFYNSGSGPELGTTKASMNRTRKTNALGDQRPSIMSTQTSTSVKLRVISVLHFWKCQEWPKQMVCIIDNQA